MLDELRRLASRILRMVAPARLQLVDDSGDQQRAQVVISAGGPEGVEEVIDRVAKLAHYGFAYCPPDGSEAVVMFVGGRRSAGVIVATGHRDSRPKDLQPGEAMIYDGLRDTWIRLCADGKIRSKGEWLHEGAFAATGLVTSDVDVKVTAGDVSLKDHTHPGVQSGSSNTGAPN